MKTRRGIYHNLYDSTYSISNQEVEYFFSSKLYLEKFLEEYQENREKVRRKLSRGIDCSNLNFDLLADVHLYRTIEKRGFRIRIRGDESTWLKSRLFGLAKVTEKSIKDYEETQEQK